MLINALTTYARTQKNNTRACAGNNILYIGMYGPKGPCEEVQVKHLGRNQYQINYYVRERGDYILIVKWGEEHIPGSPFRAEV